MKRLFKKTSGWIKGAPTAMVVSIAIHLLLFFVLGGMVVFSVVKKKIEAFKPPPPIERPKMDLKRPKVKVKKQIQPKSASRIVSKSAVSMTEFSMPETSGISEGLRSGIGGFEMMPDISKMSLLGARESISAGNEFEGTLYLLGLDPLGRRNTLETSEMAAVVGRFTQSGWNPRSLMMYYRWPKKLYTTFFYIPNTLALQATRSFGVPDEMDSLLWLAIYKGKIASETGGRFRFWARGDSFMGIRVKGKEVVQGGHKGHISRYSDWVSTDKESLKYARGQAMITVGDWFDLEPGVPVDMEVLFGDFNGFLSSATVTVQEKGVEYPRRREDNAPILPIFRTADLPLHVMDEIIYKTIKDDVDLYNDLKFNVR